MICFWSYENVNIFQVGLFPSEQNILALGCKMWKRNPLILVCSNQKQSLNLEQKRTQSTKRFFPIWRKQSVKNTRMNVITVLFMDFHTRADHLICVALCLCRQNVFISKRLKLISVSWRNTKTLYTTSIHHDYPSLISPPA